MRVILSAILYLGGAAVAVAQQSPMAAPPAGHVKHGCDMTSPLPYWGAVTNGLIATKLPDSTLAMTSATQPTGSQPIKGLVQYTVRVLMHTPEDNRPECSVRQFRLILPKLLTAADSSGGKSVVPDPSIQVTMESPDAIGAGAAMLVFSIERVDTIGAFTEYVIDVQTPLGSQSPYTYYGNFRVTGLPK
jgi:hypothetical protein